MKRFLVIFNLLLIIASCSPYDDLEKWVSKTDKNIEEKFQKNHKPYKGDDNRFTYDYVKYEGVDPFSSLKLKINDSPAMGRSKEILENYNIQDLKYVGYIRSSKGMSAFIKAEDYIYTVQVGQHLGTNYGRITRILKDKIQIEEKIETSEGDWVNRDREILLTES